MTPSAPLDPRIVEAVALMNARMSRPLTSASIAREVCLSQSRFAFLFHVEIGHPPCRYLKLLRLNEACRLLRETDLTVKEIAVRVGMPDVSHFVRDFEAVHGSSPLRFRGQAKATKS